MPGHYARLLCKINARTLPHRKGKRQTEVALAWLLDK